MSACTAASVEDAANNLLEELNSGAKCLCVEHDASDDVAPALLLSLIHISEPTRPY